MEWDRIAAATIITQGGAESGDSVGVQGQNAGFLQGESCGSISEDTPYKKESGHGKTTP